MEETLTSANYCSFCSEVRNSDAPTSLCFATTETAIALPTLGCFALGYSLIVPKRHIVSLAEAGAEEWQHIFDFAETVRAQIEDLFGPVMLAEHGTGSPDEPTAACCVHAHLHAIPVAKNYQTIRAEYEKIAVGKALDNPNQISEYEGISYLTLSPKAGEWHVWSNASRFPRQCVRRAAAGSLNTPELFDWKLHQFPERMRETSILMKLSLANS